MNTRRSFLQASALLAAAGAAPRMLASPMAANGARVVSTWDFGVGANQAAWKVLAAGGSALDAVEAGARWAESDLCNPTVGRCGNPDRDGVLTLDASIMAGDGRCGSGLEARSTGGREPPPAVTGGRFFTSAHGVAQISMGGPCGGLRARRFLYPVFQPARCPPT